MSTPFVPAPNCVELGSVHNLLDQVVENVYHVQLDAAPDQARLTTLANAIITWERENASPLRHTGDAMVKATARDMSVQDGLGVEVQPNPVIQGGDNTGRNPNSVALAVKHSTGLAGRSRRGRTFWFGIPTGANLNTNFVTQAYNANVIAALTALRTRLNALSGTSMVVVSKRANKQWRAVALITPIASFSSDGVLDNQRRRLPGRGK